MRQVRRQTPLVPSRVVTVCYVVVALATVPGPVAPRNVMPMAAPRWRGKTPSASAYVAPQDNDSSESSSMERRAQHEEASKAKGAERLYRLQSIALEGNRQRLKCDSNREQSNKNDSNRQQSKAIGQRLLRRALPQAKEDLWRLNFSKTRRATSGLMFTS